MENGADVRSILRILYVVAAAKIAIGARDALDVAPNVGIMLGALLIAAFPALRDHYTF
ncbi:hypothetical protein [Bradyrhizobium sp. CCBAU 51753]|uniref:hypothetical protein n=1 Tax=Bradyrhizobium sp. CCBAU 51753 TaxID=1325100 RepID=UPI00188A6516|nr:hypothetical protein [Bradyrhizobium sp. CCBAU 51753]